MIPTDVLVLGSGIAGLTFAIQLAERRSDISIRVCSKANTGETNTRYAQGGIAAVTDFTTDSFEQHIRDTLEAGRGYCDKNMVRAIVEAAPERIAELAQWGVPFDRNSKGKWDTGLEGGHSESRILHCRDRTGLAITQTLLRRAAGYKNIRFCPGLFIVDLLVRDKQCHGIRYVDPDSGKIKNSHAKITFLATGGSGQVFKVTTNPEIATGDGVAMAARAGAQIRNMVFYQFHPTAFAAGKSNPAFLISEAVRGFGAYIINTEGERFLFRYHSRGELATRDIVSNAIFSEYQKNEENRIYLDCRHLDERKFYRHFPEIANQCLKAGFDLFKTPVPIMPAAHYQCGGVTINPQGQTSVQNLYANGECACSGLHGANRLASNSLLEAVVISHGAAVEVASVIDHIPIVTFPENPGKPGRISQRKPMPNEIGKIKTRLQELMYIYHTGKITGDRTKKDITSLWELISGKTDIPGNTDNSTREFYELKNLITVARMLL
ncbi:L-aspartate oxidase [Sinomicrobium pectinilyticum]|uniref:L-aspartate oxidase n=1 Tax=Sinomicrobium pectinilyticum TaxID=1084421 RepID=A0A3N0DP24_SINP1|nr:L-aspartate oxidase [Sinomicrobium pectinilyticum]RNL77407.1 L-aspartate oxidase [Sinomicrobium pectinilyticum]